MGAESPRDGGCVTDEPRLWLEEREYDCVQEHEQGEPPAQEMPEHRGPPLDVDLSAESHDRGRRGHRGKRAVRSDELLVLLVRENTDAGSVESPIRAARRPDMPQP
jgi:hypothetical protein